jgi:Lon protease-like protein
MQERRVLSVLRSLFLLVNALSQISLGWAWTTASFNFLSSHQGLPSSSSSSSQSSSGSSPQLLLLSCRFAAKKATRRERRCTSLFASKNDDDEEEDDANIPSNADLPPKDDEKQEDRKRRMAVVRSLQMSFYSSSSSSSSSQQQQQQQQQQGDDDKDDENNTHPHMDRETGKLKNLPLWRVQWWEVPGRSNVLNVHEPIYTNMFETILYGPKPWCFGHLYLQGGSRNLNSDEDKYQLETWEGTTTPTTSHTEQSSAVIGCLMNISDYRRMADGRLLLLVHGMERFVVTDVVQKLPYSIVHAQVLPDLEEMDPDLNVSKKRGRRNDVVVVSEELLRSPRALAIQESVRFHDYEYDRNHALPVPTSGELESKDILRSDIAKVLPFAPFSKTLEPPQESPLKILTSDRKDSPATSSSSTSSTDQTKNEDESEESCLEYRLLSAGVLQIPGVDHSSSSSEENQQQQSGTHGLATEELEYDLWLAINNFLTKTRTPVSPVLLGLLPTYDYDDDDDDDDAWPEGFVLKRTVQELNDLDSVDHDFVLVSKEYPAYRRQRRLAYCAAHLLETDENVTNELRPRLLAAPSTRDRLRLVLEGFDHWQQEQWGAFE